MSKDTPVCFRVDPISTQEHRALRSLEQGQATELEQKMALALIVKKLAVTHDMPFVPGAADQTTFLAGRTFVGKQILKLINTSPEDMKEKTNG